MSPHPLGGSHAGRPRVEDAEAPLWVFGYGSLIWRPDFPYLESRPAQLSGFQRRFWQGSTDHRGVPGAPGRVVTLEASQRSSCAGVAFRIEGGREQGVLEALDRRESGGFERLRVAVELRAGPTVTAITYRAAAGNPNYLGPAPLHEVAAQVRRCHGPSGSNREYVVELARALRAHGASDPHVFELERLVAALED